MLFGSKEIDFYISNEDKLRMIPHAVSVVIGDAYTAPDNLISLGKKVGFIFSRTFFPNRKMTACGVASEFFKTSFSHFEYGADEEVSAFTGFRFSDTNYILTPIKVTFHLPNGQSLISNRIIENGDDIIFSIWKTWCDIYWGRRSEDKYTKFYFDNYPLDTKVYSLLCDHLNLGCIWSTILLPGGRQLKSADFIFPVFDNGLDKIL